MKIGIIETGVPPASLVSEHGTYATMTRRFLGTSHDYETYRVFDGPLPDASHGCDGFAITGSACGVKDGLAWVEDLIAFLREDCASTKLVGICFGHQVMAQAFGGNVVKAPQGWGLGLHQYQVDARATWMDDADVIWGTASHQDQVIGLPPASRILGSSAFTPYAIIEYLRRPAISVQFHPEFTPEFSRALFKERRIAGLSSEQVESAITSLEAPNDNSRMARWINRFLAA